MPFHHDEIVRVIERPFGDRRDLTVDRFHESCGRPGSTPSATSCDPVLTTLPAWSWGSTRSASSRRGPTAAPSAWLEVLEEAELAERVGLDVFGVGEHHRPDFAVSAPAVVLAAVAARTSGSG